MEVVHGVLGPAHLVLAGLLPDWIVRLDGANAVIGVLTLLVGVLGVAYMAFVFVSTPLPRTVPESAEEAAYPTADRFLVPLMLPIGVALAIAATIFFTSQILLAVNEAVATPIALALALFILIVCSVVATAPQVPVRAIYTLVAVPIAALVIAGSAAGLYRQAEEQKAAEARANAPATSLAEVTTDNKFSKTSYIIPAGQSVTLAQDNKGLAIHNWHVLDVKDTSGKDVTTTLTQPGQTTSVTFTLAAPGSYKFQCDVHPTEMVGTLKVQ